MSTPMHLGVFVPQGWKTELASIDGAAAQWAKTVEIVRTMWTEPPTESGASRDAELPSDLCVTTYAVRRRCS